MFSQIHQDIAGSIWLEYNFCFLKIFQLVEIVFFTAIHQYCYIRKAKLTTKLTRIINSLIHKIQLLKFTTETLIDGSIPGWARVQSD